MAEEYKSSSMEISMMVSMEMVSPKEMESIIGTMERFIGGNLKMEFVMGMDNGRMERKNMKAST